MPSAKVLDTARPFGPGIRGGTRVRVPPLHLRRKPFARKACGRPRRARRPSPGMDPRRRFDHSARMLNPVDVRSCVQVDEASCAFGASLPLPAAPVPSHGSRPAAPCTSRASTRSSVDAAMSRSRTARSSRGSTRGREIERAAQAGRVDPRRRRRGRVNASSSPPSRQSRVAAPAADPKALDARVSALAAAVFGRVEAGERPQIEAIGERRRTALSPGRFPPRTRSRRGAVAGRRRLGRTQKRRVSVARRFVERFPVVAPTTTRSRQKAASERLAEREQPYDAPSKSWTREVFPTAATSRSIPRRLRESARSPRARTCACSRPCAGAELDHLQRREQRPSGATRARGRRTRRDRGRRRLRAAGGSIIIIIIR